MREVAERVGWSAGDCLDDSVGPGAVAAGDRLRQVTEHRSVLGRYSVRDRARDPGLAVEVDVFDLLAGLVADDGGGFGDGERFGPGQAVCLAGVSVRVGQCGRGYRGDVFGVNEGLRTVP